MKSKGLFIISALIIILLSVHEPISAQDDLEAIDQVRMDFNAASSESDAEALAELLDIDAVWMPPGHEPVVGREAIKAYYAKRFAEQRSDIRLHPGPIQLMEERAELHSSFSRIDAAGSDHSPHIFSGNYMWILKKQEDNTWKVTRDIWNEVPENAELSNALDLVEIFSGLTAAERKILKPAADLRLAKAGEQITEQGTSPGKMFIIMDGKAGVWREGNLVTTLSGQFIIGETEFLNKLPMFVDVIIQDETELIVLDNEVLTGLMEKHPRIGYVIMHELAVMEALRLRETTISSFSSAQ